MQETTLLNELRAIDFAIHDTVLYLYAYPSPEACAYLEKLIGERNALACAFYKTHGALTMREMAECSRYTETPMPWELEAN